DTTYIPTDDGFMYLTSIMDLYSRSIIAWDLADTLSTEVVIPIIKEAKRERQTSHPLIIHSDCGSQFTSQSFRKVTGSMTNSYSKKGYPWDNACIEAFHAVIKREWLNRFHIKGKVEAERLCFEYIDAYYNTVRIHSHCHYMSPREYEKLYYEHNKRRHAA
ncbi:DDE-type integrase/transposase/recombinase, partial [Limosilactobacillus fermentum]